MAAVYILVVRQSLQHREVISEKLTRPVCICITFYIDPYSAISARTVFRHFGHVCPEKQQIFPFSPHLSKIFIVYRICPVYQIKAHGMLYNIHTLELVHLSKFMWIFLVKN